MTEKLKTIFRKIKTYLDIIKPEIHAMPDLEADTVSARVCCQPAKIKRLAKLLERIVQRVENSDLNEKRTVRNSAKKLDKLKTKLLAVHPLFHSVESGALYLENSLNQVLAYFKSVKLEGKEVRLLKRKIKVFTKLLDQLVDYFEEFSVNDEKRILRLFMGLVAAILAINSYFADIIASNSTQTNNLNKVREAVTYGWNQEVVLLTTTLNNMYTRQDKKKLEYTKVDGLRVPQIEL